MGKQPGCEPARGTRDFGAVGEIGGVHGSIVSRTTEIMRKDRNQRVGLRQNPSYTAKKICDQVGQIVRITDKKLRPRHTITCAVRQVSMSPMNILALAGILSEAALVGILLYKRVGKKLPVFLVYCCWALISDSTAYGLRAFFPDASGIDFYISINVVDFALQLCVLVELAWSVLRPLQSYLSLKALPLIGAAVLAAGAAMWPFAGLAGMVPTTPAWHFLMQLQQTASILRVLFFLLITVCSQMLSMGWRDRELQVATGFGFYSLVSLAVAVLNTHHATTARFKNLYTAVAISFVCSLFYWAGSFAQKEAERHEFTPKMQHTLLALAEAVHVRRGNLGEKVGSGG